MTGLGGLRSGVVLLASLMTGCWVVDPGIQVDPGYYVEDPPDAGSCPSRLVASGVVQAGPVAIDYGGGQVAVKATHKLDVDVIEDGCVARLELTVSTAQGQCPLRLVFQGSNGNVGGLVEARLTADSECPGFLDAVEGLYSAPPGFAPWSYLGPQDVPEHGVSAACMEGVHLGFPDRPLRLYRDSPSAAELTVDLKGLELNGTLFSAGDTEARCFDVSGCGPGLHDGGDGWCVDAGRCSPGYALTPGGSCAR